MTTIDWRTGRDLALLERGWERNAEGLYRQPGASDWLTPAAARIEAGLDAPPPPPRMVTITALDLDRQALSAAVKLPSGIAFTCVVPLIEAEAAQLAALLEQVAARIRAELGAPS